MCSNRGHLECRHTPTRRRCIWSALKSATWTSRNLLWCKKIQFFSSQRSGRWNGLDIPVTCKTPKESCTNNDMWLEIWISHQTYLHRKVMMCPLMWPPSFPSDAAPYQMMLSARCIKVCTLDAPSQVGHFMVWKPELHSSCCRWWVTFSFSAISILKINSFHICFPF